MFNYRPQTKFSKVMFLHVSVCPQGGGVCLWSWWVWQTPPGQTPLGKSPLGRPPGQTPLSPGRHPPGQMPTGRHSYYAVHAGMWSTSGRYASHWNAFLFYICQHHSVQIMKETVNIWNTKSALMPLLPTLCVCENPITKLISWIN